MSDRTFTSTQKWLLGSAAAAVVVLLVVIGVVVAGDDDESGVVADSSVVDDDHDERRTPRPRRRRGDHDDRVRSRGRPLRRGLPEPDEQPALRLARSRRPRPTPTDVLGFTELVASDFMQGDSRSGEIAITDREGNPTTTVFVRQMEDDAWYVLGSVAEDITVEKPEARDAITDPFDTAGVALAFEGTVDVIVRTQGDPEVIGEGFVTGAGTPPAGPFEGSIEFTPPAEETPGIVVYRTLSAEDGHVLQATSFPVRLQST